jgi:hypothetical protein
MHGNNWFRPPEQYHPIRSHPVNRPIQIRQGDVLLLQVAALPSQCTTLPADGTRLVLAHGEVTGHAHAIYDHCADDVVTAKIASDLATAAIARAQAKARLWQGPNGDRYLEVTAAVTLQHEEHTQHQIPPGIYHLPRQVEYAPERIFDVED